MENRIVQILNNLSFGDAIGNHALNLFHELKNRGINTEIYALIIDPRLEGIVKPYY